MDRHKEVRRALIDSERPLVKNQAIFLICYLALVFFLAGFEIDFFARAFFVRASRTDFLFRVFLAIGITTDFLV